MKIERRHVSAESDLVRRSAQEIGEGGSAARNYRVGFSAGRVLPVRVRVVIQKVVADRIDHWARDLGAARTIEICNRLRSMAAEQRWEMFPNFDRRSGLRSMRLFK